LNNKSSYNTHMEDSTRIHDNLYYDERSAGGIVYKLENGRTWWLVIKTLTKRQLNRMGERVRRTVYKFPKGHLDKGEVLKKAALREVEEEGQVISKIVTKIGSNDYRDRRKFKSFYKRTIYEL